VLSTLYARLGNPDKAHELFIKSYKANEVPPFGVLAETAGGTNPYFATGAGGMLQAIIFGFGGLTITDQGIQQIRIRLPKNWRSVELKGVGVNRVNYIVK
jgi:protein-glucosylgalactosylhydroxylysine glucosidase